MPRMTSPLSSSFIGNFTWSYIFIHHMICVLLGASFYFVSICLLLFRIMFCISTFNKNVKDRFYRAYFASIHVAVSKQKVYRCCKNSLEKSENGIMLKLFCIMSSDKSYTAYYFSHNFWSQVSMMNLAFFTDCTVLADCCYVCICLLV